MNLSIFENEEQMVQAENLLLEQCELIKKNDRVYYAKQTPSAISKNNLIVLKNIARFKGLSMCRVCMHTNDNETIHEMLMIHTKPHYTKPHYTKSLKQHKISLSYHVIEGFAELNIYGDNQVLKQQIVIGDKEDQIKFIRLDADKFRSLESKSDYFIFLEVANGPFKDSDTVWMEQDEY
jgi:cupin fold WbuC family metalloprotein